MSADAHDPIFGSPETFPVLPEPFMPPQAPELSVIRDPLHSSFADKFPDDDLVMVETSQQQQQLSFSLHEFLHSYYKSTWEPSRVNSPSSFILIPRGVVVESLKQFYDESHKGSTAAAHILLYENFFRRYIPVAVKASRVVPEIESLILIHSQLKEKQLGKSTQSTTDLVIAYGVAIQTIIRIRKQSELREKAAAAHRGRMIIKIFDD